MEAKHSGLGIASFIISLVAGLAILIAIVIAGIMEANTPGGIDENSPEAILLGLVLIGMMFLDLVALGLGIGALFQRDRKKIFAILGTIFSGVVVLGTAFLMVIGSMMG
ncbi:MAG TPA: hypothetical protein VKZ64_06150 [Arenimonas sp.]|jgi:hypothetical protein|nr:hypothetical protein [Arenimonas sp.]